MSETEADILIIGGGFGGLSCFQAVDRKKRKVTLLADRNHFLFTPLLPLAATGAVEVRSIVEPLRSFEKEKGEVLIGKATDLDATNKKVTVRFQAETKEQIKYQTLVLAMGAAVATFDIPGVEAFCSFIKEMKDARALREKIILQFERASHLEGDSKWAALNFVIVGGGPSGVETACEIHDLIKRDFKRDFPQLIPFVRIQIIESEKEILSIFDKTLVAYAQRKLKQKGILVLTQTPVIAVERNQVILSQGKKVEAETIIWATGNAANSFTKRVAERLNLTLESRGRIPIKGDLSVARSGFISHPEAGRPKDLRPEILRFAQDEEAYETSSSEYPEIYAIGDLAALKDAKNRLLPATAQVAMKQGMFLGRALSIGERGRSFHFKSMGMLASLGEGSAIAEVRFLRLKGLLAMWFWKAAYLTRLVSLRNKVSVLFDWIKVSFFGRNTARIDF